MSSTAESNPKITPEDQNNKDNNSKKRKSDEISKEEDDDVTFTLKTKAFSPLYEWINGQFTKICLYVESEKELLDIYEEAKQKGLICSSILDCIVVRVVEASSNKETFLATVFSKLPALLEIDSPIFFSPSQIIISA